MNVLAALATQAPILTEGAVIERLRRTSGPALHPRAAHSGFIYDTAGAAALGTLYWEYYGIARAFGLPMLSFTPTWRANPERLEAAGLAARDVNGDAVRFLEQLRDEACAVSSVAIGGLVGCYGDAYTPEQGLSEEDAAEFHAWQARALAAAAPDFLFAATLPALPEALGLTRALAPCGLPYFLSFITGDDGALLDGTPLSEAIAAADAAVSPAPAGYFVNCVHPATFARALEANRPARLVGFQANTSRKSPREREGLAELETETPAAFAEMMADLRNRFGLQILGGCCGTEGAHIRALAARVVEHGDLAGMA